MHTKTPRYALGSMTVFADSYELRVYSPVTSSISNTWSYGTSASELANSLCCDEWHDLHTLCVQN